MCGVGLADPDDPQFVAFQVERAGRQQLRQHLFSGPGDLAGEERIPVPGHGGVSGLGEVTSFTAFFVGQALISGHAPRAALGDPGVARAVVGAGLALTALAVLSVAVGALLRHPAAAIACLIAVLLVLPGIAQALPGSWRNPVTEFWPTQAGGQLTSVHHSAHTLQPWPGFGVMCLFVAFVYAIAWTLLDRRTHDGGQGASPYPGPRPLLQAVTSEPFLILVVTGGASWAAARLRPDRGSD